MRTKQNSPETLSYQCTPAEIELLKLIRDQEATDLFKALRSVHDTVLYYSNIEFGKTERMELLNIRLLSDAIEGIGKEG